MGTMSFMFFGLMLIPFILFLVWVIKQDKKKNYLGLFFLVFGIIVAVYTIVRLDNKFMMMGSDGRQHQVAPKSSNFK